MGTMISKIAFKAMFEKLPQTIEEVVIKKNEISILGVVLRTDLGTQILKNWSHHKTCSQHGQRKDHTS